MPRVSFQLAILKLYEAKTDVFENPSFQQAFQITKADVPFLSDAKKPDAAIKAFVNAYVKLPDATKDDLTTSKNADTTGSNRWSSWVNDVFWRKSSGVADRLAAAMDDNEETAYALMKDEETDIVSVIPSCRAAY